MQLQHKQQPVFVRDQHSFYLSLLRHSVEHVGHLKEMAKQAQAAQQYTEAWMWHCLIMMFGFDVRAGQQALQAGHEHLREAIRRHDIAYKLSLNEEQQARELAQYLFDAMGAKTRRKIARHNHQRMIQ
ncbi:MULTISPECIES: hypothetical protein [Deefgea]|uniref:Uncharacterized protein n=1 Tax=Deefgea chitinilytica TaxID=570276 RepID=A0ABS2CEM5_9NEIS|nr:MULTISPECIES: hypothetical protein [Deefgea]MBM5572609.1 hypothetical protein [Deefgea chitinilytica]MBM9889845.1 hypothetical protein [Deefgea sp. CFH1-16]